MALVFACATIALLVDACVIADPVTDLPQFPDRRPTILRSSVVPSASAVLGRWPGKFIVPVDLIDPRQTFFYSSFVDYDPINGAGFKNTFPSDFEPGSGTTQGSVRTIDVPIEDPPSPDRCHIVEIIVALRFVSTRDTKGLHTPDEPGGDSVSWIYNPTGDLSGCPLVDAGLVPISIGDADAEGGPK
jgi:hypothetical protein